MQSLTVGLETKILNDLDDKIKGLTRIMANNPKLIKVVGKSESHFTHDLAFSYHGLCTFDLLFICDNVE